MGLTKKKKVLIIFSCALLSVGCLLSVYFLRDTSKPKSTSKNDIVNSTKEIENINARDNVVDADVFEESVSSKETINQTKTKTNNTTKTHVDTNKNKEKDNQIVGNKGQKEEDKKGQEKEEEGQKEETQKPENNQPEDNSDSKLEIPEIEEPGWLSGIY